LFSSLSASQQQGQGLQCGLTGSSGNRQLARRASGFASRALTLAALSRPVSAGAPLSARRNQRVARLFELDFDLHDDFPDQKVAPEMQSGPGACAARAARIRSNRPVRGAIQDRAACFMARPSFDDRKLWGGGNKRFGRFTFGTRVEQPD
jgi:hypothetical protein